MLSFISGVLSILAVDLYDTSTDEDVNINKQLLKLGVAWSDPLLTEGNNVESTSLNLVSLLYLTSHKKAS